MSQNQTEKKAVEVFEPATLGDMVALNIFITAHCRDCGHWDRLNPESLGIPLTRSIPSLEAAFVCSICKSRNTCAMPEYRKPKPS